MAEHHGFKCTVLFAIDPATGAITPSHQTNIPGLEALEDADLAVFLLRFRNLPDDQMKTLPTIPPANRLLACVLRLTPSIFR